MRVSDYRLLRLVAVVVVLCSISSCGHQSKTADCEFLKWLGTCALNYKDVYGHLPPPAVLDQNSRRMHSWRVLLLPFIEANAFYSHYDFDAAWNDPSNADLADGTRRDEGAKFPEPASVRAVYQPHLAGASSEDFTTDFLMVLRGDEPLVPFNALSGRTEGKELQVPAATDEMLLVQVRKSEVHWMEPRDIALASPAPEWSVPLDDLKDDILGSVLVSSDGRVTCRDREATLKLLAARKSKLKSTTDGS